MPCIQPLDAAFKIMTYDSNSFGAELQKCTGKPSPSVILPDTLFVDIGLVHATSGRAGLSEHGR